MEYNLLKISFFIISFSIVVVSSIINCFEPYVPQIILKSCLYGKLYPKTVLGTINVPRRWFKHFYVFAALWSSLWLLMTAHLYIFNGKLIPFMNELIDFFASHNRTAKVGASSTFIAMTLLTVHCWKRFYESYFVNVFSDTTMSLMHYVAGFYHYFGAFVAIVAEAPGFAHISPELNIQALTNAYTLKDSTVGVVLLWASWNQYKAFTTLANLRKDKNGGVVNKKHFVPEGGLFELVSTPHITCEIIVYLCLTMILWGNTTWLYVVLWVVCNQVECAFLTHWWYRKSFKDYPATRCALIPYVV